MKRVAGTTEDKNVVAIPNIVSMTVIVGIKPTNIVITIGIEQVVIAVRDKKYIECLPLHHPSNTLRVESYSAS